MPIGVRQEDARGCSPMASPFIGGISPSPGPPEIDIDSTPAAMPIRMSPAAIDAAMLATACRPEEHWRLSEYMGVVYGYPARSMAVRAGSAYAPPSWTVEAGAFTDGNEHRVEEVVGGRVLERAAPCPANGRPHRVDHDHIIGARHLPLVGGRKEKLAHSRSLCVARHDGRSRACIS
eukprot:scaffold29143_cov143-Isochrysis_galbana.AAC.2